MSLRVLVDDQISKLFRDNPELNGIDKNKFEIAVAAFANLKHLNGIDLDDLISGIMGNGGDEGIDHCYIFSNGVIVNDEDHPINKESHVKVKFIQAKKEGSFSTDGFRKTAEGIKEIFDLELELKDLAKIGANKEFQEKAGLIRKIYRKSALERAKFSCEVLYVTVAPSGVSVSDKIRHIADDLQNNELGVPFTFHFLGAQDLLSLTDREDETVEVNFVSQPLEIKERDIETSGYSGFVRGNDLVKCLSLENGEFKTHLTEGNVRYFLGEDTTINSSIIESAKDENKSEIFWALNNGLTIIGESITPLGGNQYSVQNPQIVNGCQTIHCLYDAYSDEGRLPDHLKVFVKIVDTQDIDIQTDIISATNSQNPVKAASLKANDRIQRNIEQHLFKFDIFYERRENFYKRQGYTGNRVIGLMKMAQIMNTMLNRESIISLNDIGTVFNNVHKYNSLFSDAADFDLYAFCVTLFQRTWSLKNSDLRTNEYSALEKSLISKSGWPILSVMGCFIMSESKITKDGVTEPVLGKIDINTPQRKNPFSLRKQDIAKKIENADYLKNCYERSKVVVLTAIDKFALATNKEKISAFKHRAFDQDYLEPILSDYYEI